VSFVFATSAVAWAWFSFSWFASAYDNDDWSRVRRDPDFDVHSVGAGLVPRCGATTGGRGARRRGRDRQVLWCALVYAPLSVPAAFAAASFPLLVAKAGLAAAQIFSRLRRTSARSGVLVPAHDRRRGSATTAPARRFDLDRVLGHGVFEVCWGHTGATRQRKTSPGAGRHWKMSPQVRGRFRHLPSGPRAVRDQLS
jgi:hypothetical protein